jgi:hypothetical protein
LGWAPLFYVDRAGALLGALGMIALVGWHALHGRFPIKFANIEYADELKASAETVEAQESRLKAAEDAMSAHEKRLTVVENTDDRHEGRLELIEAVLGLAESP